MEKICFATSFKYVWDLFKEEYFRGEDSWLVRRKIKQKSCLLELDWCGCTRKIGGEQELGEESKLDLTDGSRDMEAL